MAGNAGGTIGVGPNSSVVHKLLEEEVDKRVKLEKENLELKLKVAMLQEQLKESREEIQALKDKVQVLEGDGTASGANTTAQQCGAAVVVGTIGPPPPAAGPSSAANATPPAVPAPVIVASGPAAIKRPFKCDQCHASYWRAGALKNHLEKKHDVSDASLTGMVCCRKCSRTFDTRGLFLRHLSDSHAGELSTVPNRKKGARNGKKKEGPPNQRPSQVRRNASVRNARETLSMLGVRLGRPTLRRIKRERVDPENPGRIAPNEPVAGPSDSGQPKKGKREAPNTQMLRKGRFVNYRNLNQGKKM